MSDSRPFFSVIICTKGGGQLKECLNAIILDLIKSHESYETILVAHKSTALHIFAITSEYLKESVNIKCIVQDRNGLPNARNCGLKSATGEVIVFLDDDVSIIEGYFSGLKGICSKSTEFGGITGTFKCATITPSKFSRWKAILDLIFVGSWHGEGGSIGKVFSNGMTTCNFDVTDKIVEVDRLSGCNMVYPKHVTDECGFFDEGFEGGYAALEDADYSYRVRKRGYKLFVHPGLKLAHAKTQHESAISPNRIYYVASNGVYFFFKNLYTGKARQYVSFTLAHLYTFSLLLVGGLWYRKAFTGPAYLRGLLDAFGRSRFRIALEKRRDLGF